ncbi:sialate O-acetylesterase [Flammeovirga aprica]|uniref:Sialate O-acetylesterase n=1 Tax=Flammeovirga aprica JL-4 TaxID=694437 RepID=A0A7X9RXS6_9BACT|nr:sialate O-acetylesterase [Flammeovirga aprica]NME70743.1 sialate O-acetylesterase [Flammeovirga aprica JL-4]
MKKLYFLVVLFLPFLSLQAQVKLSSIFTDDMVLQAEKEIKVWGKAKPSATLFISLGKSTTTVKVDENGKWMAVLPAMKYGGPYQLKVEGDGVVILNNVMLGEVWFCAGQSNMRWFVRDSNNKEEEIANADYPNIRFFVSPLKGTHEPQDEIKNVKWEVCTPKSIQMKTAVGYFFGRELHKELKGVAIGLIDISYGGASITAFMDKETGEKSKQAEFIKTYTGNFLKAYNEKKAKWDENPEGKPPFYPENVMTAMSYNAMVHPLVPFQVRGAIWYQGETNAWHPERYIDMFGEYITMMRSVFQNPEMPYYFVQLAGFKGRKGAKRNLGRWGNFRLAQEECLKFENTGMATAFDVGQDYDIHPRNKQEVGRRLSLLALKNTYGKKKVIDKGPTLKSVGFKGDKVILTFDNVAKKLVLTSGENVKGFLYKIGNDYEEVEAKLIGKNKIEIPYKEGELYYAYENYFEPNLYNSVNLPATPFKAVISKPVK